LSELNRIPVTAVSDAVEERLVLRGAHSVHRDVKMPMLAHVVRRRRRALIAVRTTRERNRGRTFIDDAERERIRRQRRSG